MRAYMLLVVLFGPCMRNVLIAVGIVCNIVQRMTLKQTLTSRPRQAHTNGGPELEVTRVTLIGIPS